MIPDGDVLEGAPSVSTTQKHTGSYSLSLVADAVRFAYDAVEASPAISFWVYLNDGYSGDFNWSPLTQAGEIMAALGPGRDMTAEYGEGKFIAHKFQSVHGCGDPSASLSQGTEEAILAMAGPTIQSGAKLDTVPDLTAAAPTLAAACGLPAPADAQGVVLEALLAGKDDG